MGVWINTSMFIVQQISTKLSQAKCGGGCNRCRNKLTASYTSLGWSGPQGENAGCASLPKLNVVCWTQMKQNDTDLCSLRRGKTALWILRPATLLPWQSSTAGSAFTSAVWCIHLTIISEMALSNVSFSSGVGISVDAAVTDVWSQMDFIISFENKERQLVAWTFLHSAGNCLCCFHDEMLCYVCRLANKVTP